MARIPSFGFTNLVNDCFNVIFSFFTGKESKNTAISLLRVDKKYNANWCFWRQLSLQLYEGSSQVIKVDVRSREVVQVIKSSFFDWKNNKDKKEKRKSKTYKDFIYSDAYYQYVDNDLMDYAIKTRNMELAIALRDNQRFNCFRGYGLYERALLSSLLYGNIEAFNIWFEYKKCVVSCSSFNSVVMWINTGDNPDGTLAGISSEDVRKILYNGHVDSLRLLEKKFDERNIPRSILKDWLKRMDYYRLVKTRKFKSIEYLIEIGAGMEFDFSSTGRQGRRDRNPNKTFSNNSNCFVVSNLFNRYGEKFHLDSHLITDRTGKYTQAMFTWGAVMACVRASFRVDGYYPMKSKDPRFLVMHHKARHLLKHPFISHILTTDEINTDHQHIFDFLGMRIYPKHFEGCTLDHAFYYHVKNEPTLDVNVAQNIWNTIMNCVETCTDRTQCLKLLTTTFVTNLLKQVVIDHKQLEILNQKQLIISPFCIL